MDYTAVTNGLYWIGLGVEGFISPGMATAVFAQTALPDLTPLKGSDSQFSLVAILIVFIMACMLGVWRVFSWFGKEIVLPFRDKGIQHLDSVTSTLTTVRDSLKNVESSLGLLSDMPKRVERVEDKLEDVAKQGQDTAIKVSHIENVVVTQRNSNG